MTSESNNFNTAMKDEDKFTGDLHQWFPLDRRFVGQGPHTQMYHHNPVIWPIREQHLEIKRFILVIVLGLIAVIVEL